MSLDAYEDVAAVLDRIDDDTSYAPTGCVGWAVRDLVFHCAMDAQRALVALHTPTDTAPDRDAVGYWQDWGDDPVGDDSGRRFARVSASMFSRWQQLRGLYAETTRAAAHAASQADPEAVVATQGHALRVADLLSTLVVEATVHHLDLVAHLDLPGPSQASLTHTRHVVQAVATAEPGAELASRLPLLA
ncbi:hypothetical protein D9V37_00465 [Nocardioides mangrovicus]|uniref:Mycothiol-dependent maleylpyruvate isomerase metal-binding domain-containing protein n=1 Tax=Nocardioides mangrovicus TaxID=2478913 RepID=A0A3L8P6Z4_9ACTN|nr:maleylpyruvate isomerase N-terminal domain-containing protein [Nocardioides mangrovicus]RLV50503.1 hypothetical protein D9V37_00465 [Nocardioides mangrovicus]